MKKRVKLIAVSLTLFLLISSTALAHSGRTDSNGGHKDNKNASGLGSYHYHCGGYPAHLHDGGFCPYTSGAGDSSSDTGGNTTTTPQEPKKDKITIQSAPKSLNVGDSQELEFDIEFSELSSYTITSSDESVVKVNGNTIKAIGEGDADITIESYNNSETITVSVKTIPVEKISIGKVSNLKVGENEKLEITIEPENATNQELKYKSSDKDIISVTDNGTVRAEGPGTAVVTVTSANDITAEVTIKVTAIEPEEIKINAESFDIEITDTAQLAVQILPEDAFNQDYEVIVQDEDIIQLENDGTIQPLTLGDTVIAIKTWNGLKKEIPVNIFMTSAEKVIIDDSEMSYTKENKKQIDPDTEIKLTAYVIPDSATYNEITWTSSNEEIIKIQNGKFVVTGTGDVTLTASTLEEVNAEITLKVVKKSNALETVGGITVIGFSGFIIFRKKFRRP